MLNSQSIEETAMKNLTTLVAIATIATCTLTSAQANASSERYSETVPFADLNTADTKGTAVLYQRVVLAAQSVCHDLEVSGSPFAAMRFSGCWHAAVKNAVVTIKLPTLTAYAVSRGIVPAAAIQIVGRN
jgi:UrcA family protein